MNKGDILTYKVNPGRHIIVKVSRVYKYADDLVDLIPWCALTHKAIGEMFLGKRIRLSAQ